MLDRRAAQGPTQARAPARRAPRSRRLPRRTRWGRAAKVAGPTTECRARSIDQSALVRVSGGQSGSELLHNINIYNI